MDVLTVKQRSFCMSKIRSKHTGPEMVVRQLLRAIGLRYRLSSRLPGKPDIKIVGKPTVIFIDGCFWHGCKKHSKVPKTNKLYWTKKLNGNKFRDVQATRTLKANGYNVVRIWEHETKNLEKLIIKLRHKIQ
jgi:DNA mismatch endonuclease (patch repair protein)